MSFLYIKKRNIAGTEALMATEIALTVALNVTGHNPDADSSAKSLEEHDKGCKCQLFLVKFGMHISISSRKILIFFTLLQQAVVSKPL